MLTMTKHDDNDAHDDGDAEDNNDENNNGHDDNDAGDDDCDFSWALKGLTMSLASITTLVANRILASLI